MDGHPASWLMMATHYSTPLSLSSQIFHCSLPLRLDAYRGCSFSCSYCFARNRGGNTRTKAITFARDDALRRALQQATLNSPKQSAVTEFLRARVPIHFGGMSDPFQKLENKKKVTLEYLRALADFSYPTVISTRSPLIAEEQYVALLKSFPVVVQFSSSTIDDRQAKRVEPLAPPPSQVLQTMRHLSNLGITTTARWQPYIVGFSPKPKEFVQAVAEAGARQVSLEHLKITTENHWNPTLSRGSQVLEAAKRQYTKLGVHRDGREFVLDSSEKLKIALEVRSLCHKSKLAFGAGDNELQYLSDGNACCASVDHIAGFNSTYRFTIPHLVKKEILKGNIIRFSDTGLWRPVASIDRYLNSKSRLDSSNSSQKRKIDYFIQRKWNDLIGFNSPTGLHGVRFTGERDSAGMNIYWVNDETRNLVIQPSGPRGR
jgi:DNA repair photolyase